MWHSYMTNQGNREKYIKASPIFLLSITFLVFSLENSCKSEFFLFNWNFMFLPPHDFCCWDNQIRKKKTYGFGSILWDIYWAHTVCLPVCLKLSSPLPPHIRHENCMSTCKQLTVQKREETKINYQKSILHYIKDIKWWELLNVETCTIQILKEWF